MLTEEMVAGYRAKGWVKIPGAVSDADISVIRDAVEEAEILIKPDRIDLAKNGTAESAQPSRFLEEARRVFRNETDLRLVLPQLNPVIARLSKLAARLMGRTELRVLQDQTFIKPPAHAGGKPTPWHQDICYYPIDRCGLLACWIPLQDVTPETGSLWFVPRSHRLGPLGRTAGETAGSLDSLLHPADRELVGEPESVPLRVGDLTFHNGMTLHSAGANFGDRPRAAWNALFIPAETRWTGAPCGHKRLNNAGLKLLERFDDPSFRIANVP